MHNRYHPQKKKYLWRLNSTLASIDETLRSFAHTHTYYLLRLFFPQKFFSKVRKKNVPTFQNVVDGGVHYILGWQAGGRPLREMEKGGVHLMDSIDFP